MPAGRLVTARPIPGRRGRREVMYRCMCCGEEAMCSPELDELRRGNDQLRADLARVTEERDQSRIGGQIAAADLERERHVADELHAALDAERDHSIGLVVERDAARAETARLR